MRLPVQRRYKAREFMSSNRPKELRNRIDPRIRPSGKENPLLKFTRSVLYHELIARAFDIMLVCWSMKVVMNGMNKTNHYQIENLFKAMNRPKGVGLLTICNHVSVLDSASIVPSVLPFSDTLSCGSP